MLFPPILDSTMIASFIACKQKFFREYVEHWKAGEESIHLHAGAAFAAGQEAARKAYYLDGTGESEALRLGKEAILAHWGEFEAPEDSPKALHRLLAGFEYYWTQEGFSFSTERAIPKEVEFSFALPLPINNPSTGAPLLYCGRMDAVVEYCKGLYGMDDKTCSALGATWQYKWEHRAQFTGYCWAAREHGRNFAGFIVNGMAFYKEAGILKSGKKSVKQEYGLERCITYRAPWEIDRWYNQLLRVVGEMLFAFAEYERTKDPTLWLYNLDETCNAFGGCKFSQACKSRDVEVVLPLTFTKRVWNPLNHTEVSPEEWEEMWRK